MIGLSVLGIALAAYLTYVHYAGIKPACTAGQSCIRAALALTFIGFAFSAYLTYRELYSIRGVHEECAVSAVFLTFLFAGAMTRYLIAPLRPEPGGPCARSGPRRRWPVEPSRRSRHAPEIRPAEKRRGGCVPTPVGTSTTG